VNILVNGKPHELPADATVAGLLEQFQSPRFVAVEVNGEVIPRPRHAETILREGDAVELVTLMGGG
jgi:sulfur carrier protein